MKRQTKMVTLPCDCRCCMFVIEKSAWEDGDVNYNISVQDARYDQSCNSLWGRIKRAAKVLFGKPIYYNDAYLEGEEQFGQLLHEMAALTTFQYGELDETTE